MGYVINREGETILYKSGAYGIIFRPSNKLFFVKYKGREFGFKSFDESEVKVFRLRRRNKD